MNECVYNRMKNRKEKIFRWNESGACGVPLRGGGALYYTYNISIL